MLNNIKSFGFNVIPEQKGKTAEKTVESVGNAINGIWEPILDYLEKNDNVFSGEVSNEIEKLNFQAMRLNMTVNGGSEKRTLNIES